MRTYISLLIGTALTGAIAPIASAQIATVTNIQTASLQPDLTDQILSSGAPAVVSIDIISPVSITVSSPVPVGFSDPAGTQHNSTLTYNSVTVPQDIPLSIITPGEIDVEVEMQAIRLQPYTAGTYEYSVQLTIAAP